MWSEVGEQTFFGPATIVEAEENVAKVRENLEIAQRRQKSYADLKRKDVSFDVGEHVYLKVSPLRGTKRFHIRGKLSPRYVGPYPIVQRIRKVAYNIELPPELAGVHPVFHMSQLQKCVVVEKRVPTQALDVWWFYMVLWSNHSEHVATWEKESVMREKYPQLFVT
jgi:ribosomal protein L21E